MPRFHVASSMRPLAIAWSPTPSTIAVNVFLVKPSTRCGRLASTYTTRGATSTSSRPASTSNG